MDFEPMFDDIGKVRPAIIIGSANNRYFVVPTTSKLTGAEYVIVLHLDKLSQVLTHKIQIVDRGAIKGFIGRASREVMQRITALIISPPDALIVDARIISLEYREKVFAIYQELYSGQSHPDLITCLNNAGLANFELGNKVRARAFFNSAYQMARSILGEVHLDTRAYKSNLECTMSSPVLSAPRIPVLARPAPRIPVLARPAPYIPASERPAPAESEVSAGAVVVAGVVVVASALIIGGLGISLCRALFGRGSSTNKSTAGHHNEYYTEGLDRLLALRLSGTSVSIHEAVVFDEQQAGFVCPAADHGFMVGVKPVVAPVLYQSQSDKPAHWVGIVAAKSDEVYTVTYIDPENKPMPQVLVDVVLKRLPAGVVVEFGQKLVAEQSCSDNCGPELVEGLAQVVTGYRVPESEAVAFHSALYEAHLLDQAPVVGDVQHATTRPMLNTPNGSTKPFDFSYDLAIGDIIDAREVAIETPSSARPTTADQPTSASQSIPTLHLEGGTPVSDFISFIQGTAQHGANLLWNLAPLLDTAQTLLNKALDSKNIIMILLLLDTVDALHSRDPFAHAGFPGRYPGGDPDDGYDGGYGGGGGNGDGGDSLPAGSSAFGPTPTFSGQANASSGSGFNFSHALNFTGSEGDVGYAGHVANGTAGAEG